VYIIWRQEEFICVGMSGQGAKAEDFVAGKGVEDQARWLDEDLLKGRGRL
jgi:hypothetical protein